MFKGSFAQERSTVKTHAAHPITERQRPGYRSNTLMQRSTLSIVLWTFPTLAASSARALPRQKRVTTGGDIGASGELRASNTQRTGVDKLSGPASRRVWWASRSNQCTTMYIDAAVFVPAAGGRISAYMLMRMPPNPNPMLDLIAQQRNRVDVPTNNITSRQRVVSYDACGQVSEIAVRFTCLGQSQGSQTR